MDTNENRDIRIPTVWLIFAAGLGITCVILASIYLLVNPKAEKINYTEMLELGMALDNVGNLEEKVQEAQNLTMEQTQATAEAIAAGLNQELAEIHASTGINLNDADTTLYDTEGVPVTYNQAVETVVENAFAEDSHSPIVEIFIPDEEYNVLDGSSYIGATTQVTYGEKDVNLLIITEGKTNVAGATETTTTTKDVWLGSPVTAIFVNVLPEYKLSETQFVGSGEASVIAGVKLEDLVKGITAVRIYRLDGKEFTSLQTLTTYVETSYEGTVWEAESGVEVTIAMPLCTQSILDIRNFNITISDPSAPVYENVITAWNSWIKHKVDIQNETAQAIKTTMENARKVLDNEHVLKQVKAPTEQALQPGGSTYELLKQLILKLGYDFVMLEIKPTWDGGTCPIN